jgi:teichuronic acid biosynthesis glycosyltransferase TuaH
MSYFGDLLGGWGKNVVNVMYGTDDYVAGAQLMRVSAAHIRARERRALAGADVVVAITPQLAARWAELGVVPTVLPNGCWPVKDSRTAPASAAAGLPRPVVGLIGQLSERIDIDVLESIVAAGLSLLMVGPHDPRWEQHRFERLVKRPGVRYVGSVPVSEVRTYLGAIDVGITPYRDTAFNRASFPLKTLEYLGAGVPVVSADLPAARWLLADLSAHSQDRDSGQVLRLASSPAGFVDAIRDVSSPGGSATGASTDAACSRWKADLRDRCTEFAETHSWPRRAEALAAAIGLPHGMPSREMAADGPGPRHSGQMRTR